MWAPLLHPSGNKPPSPRSPRCRLAIHIHTRRAEVQISYYPSSGSITEGAWPDFVWGWKTGSLVGTWTLRWPAKLFVAGGRWEPFPKCRRPRSPRLTVPSCRGSTESGYCRRPPPPPVLSHMHSHVHHDTTTHESLPSGRHSRLPFTTTFSLLFSDYFPPIFSQPF